MKIGQSIHIYLYGKLTKICRTLFVGPEEYIIRCTNKQKAVPGFGSGCKKNFVKNYYLQKRNIINMFKSFLQLNKLKIKKTNGCNRLHRVIVETKHTT